MRRQPFRHRRSRTLGRGFAVTAIAVALAGACSAGSERDAERFCGEVQANTAAIVEPSLAGTADVVALLDLYRNIGGLAPLDIAADWDRLVVNLETASTVQPNDPDSVQRTVASAYATERAALTVHEWLLDHCAVDLGPVATIVARAPNAPAGTSPGATSPSVTTTPPG